MASACRGASALKKAGGIQAFAFRQRMIRAPTFFCDSPEGAGELGTWIQSSMPDLNRVVASVSKRAQLKSVDFFIDEEVYLVRID